MSLSRNFNILAKAKFRHPLEHESAEWAQMRADTNCYTYALNIPDHGWGRPGELLTRADKKKALGAHEITAGRIRERLLADGLVQVNLTDVDPTLHHVIAATVSRKDDYHFYRWLLDGHWAHKHGTGKVTMRDNKGELISSPETCARGAYDSFVGYFAVPPEGIVYRRDPDIKEAFWKAVTSGMPEPAQEQPRHSHQRRFQPK